MSYQLKAIAIAGEKALLRGVWVTRSHRDVGNKIISVRCDQVLRFYCVWDDRESLYGELLPFVLHFFLVDDTVEVREAHRPNDGRDPFPVLLRRQRLPKNRDNVDNSFPMVSLELSDHEVRDWFTEHDFGIGRTVLLYNRRFLIYDCDEFTKKYLRQTRGETNFTPIQVEGFAKELPKMELPEYNGYGSLEDSRQNCLHLRPQPPKKDVIKMLENLNKILRYEAKLDTMHPEDVGRRFIISYRLADDTISIFEPPKRNSGIIPGKYLEARRIPKPGSDPEYPDYYSPADLAIGSTMQVLKHRFIITGCDEYVLKTLLRMGDQIPVDTIESVRKYTEKE